MHKPTRNSWHIFLAVFGISSLSWFINTVEPSSALNILIFLLLLFATSYLLFLYIFNNARRAFLSGLAITGIAALRSLGLKDVLYIYLFLLVLLLVNLYVRRINS